MIDPRENIEHELKIGQVYRDARNDDKVMLVYLDQDVHLLRDTAGNHRMGTRYMFDEYVGSGRYKLDPEADGFGSTGRLSRVLKRAERYEEEGGRKNAHYADALNEAVSILTDDEDFEKREPIPFEDLEGIGAKAADNLRRAGFKTTVDVGRADDSELLDVAWVGEKGVNSIREYING